MLFNSIRDGRETAVVIPEVQRVALHGFNLSTEQEATVLEYYKFSSQVTLSRKEVQRLAEIWEQAETDTQLTQALNLLDSFRSHSLQEDELLAGDENLRVSLSEHLSVLAEERLMEKSGGNYQELDPSLPYVAMLCPDGSGIVYRNIPDNEFVRLDDVSQKFGEEVCGRCGITFAGHENLIFFPKKAFSPTSN